MKKGHDEAGNRGIRDARGGFSGDSGRKTAEKRQKKKISNLKKTENGDSGGNTVEFREGNEYQEKKIEGFSGE